MFAAAALHLLAAVIWVGGMFFAYVCLRPAARELLEQTRFLDLMIRVFRRFLMWVGACALVLPLTGLYLALNAWGGMSSWPLQIHLMFGLGIVMILLFLHVAFAPYRRLARAFSTGDLAEASRRLGQVRRLVAVNLALGLLVSAIAIAGRYAGL